MVTQGARGGTERNGTGPTRAAAATGRTQATTATREGQQVRMLLFFVIVSLLSSFLHLTLLLFQVISFPTSTTTGGTRKESAGRTDGANGYIFFDFLVLSTLLFNSYHSFSFSIVSFSWSITAGGQYGTDQRERRWQRGMGRGSRQA